MRDKSYIPSISVVIPTYNAGQYISDAVRSVLCQDFTDFELILIDDGSNDNTASVLQTFALDPRVQILRNEFNMGLIDTLHRAYALCRAPFIARMDADDICLPSRLGRQLLFLRANPEVGIVGGAIRFFGNVQPNVFNFPTDHDSIRAAMLFYCALAHPALMFRRELIDSSLISYSKDFLHAEDYHLWCRLLLETRAANLSEVVLNYRLHPKQVSSESSDRQYAASVRVRRKMLEDCGVMPTDIEIALHESVILERPFLESDYLERLANWFLKIEAANLQSSYWSGPALHEILKSKFLETARRIGADLSVLSKGNETGEYVSVADTRDATALKQFKLLSHTKRRLKSILWRISFLSKKFL